jgi:hypothetical protein
MSKTKKQEELFNKILNQINKNTKKSLQSDNETLDTNSNKIINQSEP